MTIENIIQNLKKDLIRTFAIADEWYDKHDELHRFKPFPDQWNVAEVLEHVSLTNQYLLALIEKGCDKALRRHNAQEKFDDRINGYTLAIPALLEIGESGSFTWHRPEHHQPQGVKPLEELRFTMRDQLFRCLFVLECLPNGEGVLHQTTMSVNGIGKLDVYQYLYFLSLHVKRHLTQMQKLEHAFSMGIKTST